MPASNNIKDHTNFSRIDEEIRLFHAIEHPLVAKLNYLSKQGEDDLLYTEYVPGGTFRQLIETVGTMKEWEARFYLAQILDIMQYLQRRGVTYGDLHSENLLIDEHGNLKMIDFGFAIRFTADTRSIYQGRSRRPKAQKKATRMYGDIREVMCLILEMFTGEPTQYIPIDDEGVKLSFSASEELREVFNKFLGMKGKFDPENGVTELKSLPYFTMDIEMTGVKKVQKLSEGIRKNEAMTYEQSHVFYEKKLDEKDSWISLPCLDLLSCMLRRKKMHENEKWISKGFKSEGDWKKLRNKEDCPAASPHGGAHGHPGFSGSHISGSADLPELRPVPIALSRREEAIDVSHAQKGGATGDL
ncbi:protein kinase domain-containing protein [Ditylenchus destructor]|uniref:Protein kinase domain-containing protein n=1 Tax=Ditylenchus destructor TaxID=166010 RepID=A0AAD4MVE3_9BILA|nr:protein kinase domain-containing protein [Ditylenchus destructor]